MAATAPKRAYRMAERAEAVGRTRRAILDAAIGFGSPRGVTLQAVADRAGVSRRTVLRHFGSRDGLISATIEAGTATVAEQRHAAPEGDVDAIAANLAEHYEEHGDRVYEALLEEGANADVDAMLEAGRRLHRDWVAAKLSPLARGLRGGPRRRRMAMLVATTDVFTWKLLRRDQGLSMEETRKALAEALRELDQRNTKGSR